MTPEVSRAVRVFFPCTGLGREQRGFEAFTRECAAALRDEPSLAITVFGGGGDARAAERRVLNLPRTAGATKMLAELLGRDPYFVEQASFFAGFLPALALGRPDVVYFADLNFGNACWHWRRLTGQRFKLLFYNGGPTTMPFTRCDLVQQVSPEHFASALARGERADRQVLLPHGLSITPALQCAGQHERARLRAALGVPAAGSLLLSVGALNASHKRMDFVIRETAALASPRPHLLMLGAENSETPSIRALAAAQLGATGFTMRTVDRMVVMDAYRAADAFVLASLHEGFGLALLEALTAGLPCVAHDSETTAFVCGPHARRADLRAPGSLRKLLAGVLAEPRDERTMRERHAWARAHFAWEVLRPRYSALLHACAIGTRPAEAGNAA